jgi:hypothetical protein
MRKASYSSVVARCTRTTAYSTAPHSLPDKSTNYVNVVSRRTRHLLRTCLHSRSYAQGLVFVRSRALHAHTAHSTKSHFSNDKSTNNVNVVSRRTRQQPCTRARSYAQGLAFARSRALHAHTAHSTKPHFSNDKSTDYVNVVSRRTRPLPRTCLHSRSYAQGLTFVRSRALHAHTAHSTKPHFSTDKSTDCVKTTSHAPSASHIHTHSTIKCYTVSI